jgi:hypothetical protein
VTKLLPGCLVAALILTVAGTSFGQVVTRSLMYAEQLRRSEVQTVSVKKRYSPGELVTEELETKIGYAIEDEFLLSSILPSLRTRPAGLIATFYIEMTQATAYESRERQFSEGSLVVECRDAHDERLIWRGVAEAVTSMTSADPYLWEQRVMEAARMLVRRFNEEGLVN